MNTEKYACDLLLTNNKQSGNNIHICLFFTCIQRLYYDLTPAEV